MFSMIDVNEFEDSKFSRYLYDLISESKIYTSDFPNIGWNDIPEEFRENENYKEYMNSLFSEDYQESYSKLALWYYSVRSEIEYYESYYSEEEFEKRYYQALGMSLRGCSDDHIKEKVFHEKEICFGSYVGYVIEQEAEGFKSQHMEFLLENIECLKKITKDKLSEIQSPIELEIFHWKEKKRIFLNEYPKRISPLVEDGFFFDRTNYKALLKMVKEYKTYKNKIPIESLINELPRKYIKEANTPKSIRVNIPLYKDWTKFMDKHPKLKQEKIGDQLNLSLYWAMEILKKDLED